MTSVDVIKYAEHPSSSTKDTIEQDQLFEEFAKLVETIKNNRDKKMKDFVRIYQIEVDYSCKIHDRILIRHFLLETVEEINYNLIKNNKSYRANFGDEMFNHFVDENNSYFKRN